MATQVNIEKVYAEMKRVRVELQTIEKTLEELADAILPTGKMDAKEAKELSQINQEMENGECILLEEAKQKFVTKKAHKPKTTAHK